MRKIAALLLALCLTPTWALGETPALRAEDFAFSLDGASYALGDPAAPLIAAIEQKAGAPMEQTEAESCMFSGKDREFANDELVIGTYPIGRNGADVTETIMVFSDAYETARGARVGQTKDEVAALYGEEYVLDYDQMIYQLGQDGPMLVFGIDLESGRVSVWSLIKNTQK